MTLQAFIDRRKNKTPKVSFKARKVAKAQAKAAETAAIDTLVNPGS